MTLIFLDTKNGTLRAAYPGLAAAEKARRGLDAFFF